jgi:hypothetical protein
MVPAEDALFILGGAFKGENLDLTERFAIR